MTAPGKHSDGPGSCSGGPDSCSDDPGNYSGDLCNCSDGSGSCPAGHFSSGAPHAPDGQFSHIVPHARFSPDAPCGPGRPPVSPMPFSPVPHLRKHFQQPALSLSALPPASVLPYSLYFHYFLPVLLRRRHFPPPHKGDRSILLFSSR